MVAIYGNSLLGQALGELNADAVLIKTYVDDGISDLTTPEFSVFCGPLLLFLELLIQAFVLLLAFLCKLVAIIDSESELLTIFTTFINCFEFCGDSVVGGVCLTQLMNRMNAWHP